MARVVMVYPGPADDLKAHSTEFLKNKQWPKEFVYLTDSSFTMVKAYGLRWDAPAETAYPSTFVLDLKNVIRFAKVSRSHGDRAKAADVIEAIKGLPATDSPTASNTETRKRKEFRPRTHSLADKLFSFMNASTELNTFRNRGVPANESGLTGPMVMKLYCRDTMSNELCGSRNNR